jgi:hypothetical protein
METLLPESAKEKNKLTVKAPIILDAKTQEGVQPLLDFVDGFLSHNAMTAARAEAQRLSSAGYFNKLAAYLSPESSEFTQVTLEKIFNGCAAYSRNVILSDVVIMPTGMQKGPAGHLFNVLRVDYDFKHDSKKMLFGFCQINIRDKMKTPRGSVTFPTFALSAKMMRSLDRDTLMPLMQDFQKVMTFVNHDMLHHYTSLSVPDAVSQKFKEADSNYIFKSALKETLKHNMDAYAKEDIGRSGYEGWLHTVHENVLRRHSDGSDEAEIKEIVSAYYDKLGLIAQHLEAESGRDVAHEVVDYFGMAMAHVLTRLYSLDDPMMVSSLQRLEKIDPLSASCGEKLQVKREKTESFLQKQKQTVQSYADHGLVMSVDDKSYLNVKNIELMKISPQDVFAHCPAVRNITHHQKDAVDILGRVIKANKIKLGTPAAP